ncbi:MAG: hypothetical protein IPP23_10060 [Sphingomonadales bacterium]|nr:hypothetical protein [Sphingomonadales bacterium]
MNGSRLCHWSSGGSIAGDARHGARDPQHRESTVLDVDALTSLPTTRNAFAALHLQCVLTPHEGEFRWLFPDLDSRQRHHGVGRAAMKSGFVAT